MEGGKGVWVTAEQQVLTVLDYTAGVALVVCPTGIS